MRPLMERALQELLEGRGRVVPLVLAPTGYGKTRASPEIMGAVRGEGLARGLIHVAPLRSLVRRIYLDVFRGVPGAGYQMSDPWPDPGKSPYLMRRLVVSTIDSFLWNLFRVPVLEYQKIARRVSDGHYYAAEAAILGSVTVLDEAHVYLGGGGDAAGAASVLAALGYLSRAARPVLLETATMHPSLAAEAAQTVRRGRGRLVLVAWRCVADRLRRAGLAGVEARVVDEEGWEGVPWRTEHYPGGWGEAAGRIVELAMEGVVLAVANTVGRAVDLYLRLRRVLGDRAVLVHGRLASSDRRRAEERLSRLGSGVVVATQVVEVGVDVNSIAVFTEPAPPENLVQRAGRACRRGPSLEWCRENAGLVALVGGPDEAETYPRGLVEYALRFTREHRDALDWRSPCPRAGAASYLDMIVQAPVRPPKSIALQHVLEGYLRYDGGPGALLQFLDSAVICSLFRGSLLIPVYTSQGIVTVGLEWLRKNKGVLAWCSEASCIVALRGGEPCGRAPARRFGVILGRGLSRCSMVVEAVRRDLEAAARGCGEGPVHWALEAGTGQYREGVGLGVA